MNLYKSLFRKRDFSLLCLADAISVTGDQAGWIALLWFAMITTHKSTEMGIIALSFGLPGVLLGAISGNILDRFSRKWVLVGVNFALGLLFLVIPCFYLFHMLSFVLLIVLVIAAGCLAPFTTVGTMVLLPKLVSEEELGPANSISEALWQFGSLLGPLLGGTLISIFGAPVAILADAITFWLAAICILMTRNLQKERSIRDPVHAKEKASFWRDSWSGLRYLYRSKPVWWITISAVFLNMTYGQLEIGLPLFVNHELSASAALLGGLWTAYFAGSILGTVQSGFWLQRSPIGRGFWMVIMIASWGVCLLPMFWVHSIWFTYVSLSLAAFVFAGYPPLARTSVQQLVQPDFQGRVFGIRMSMIALGAPIGSYVSGVLANWLVPSSVIGIAGIAAIALAVIFFSISGFRTI
jgi:predicted MFS family arabinose efflux permease